MTPADPTPPRTSDRRPSAPVLAVLATMALAHAPLPWLLLVLARRAGIPAAELAALAMHLAGPLAYLPLYRRTHLGWQGWGLVLAVNHAFVALGAVPLFT
jgi:hypothetical protein